MQIQLKKLRSMLLCVAYRPDYCPLPSFVNNFMDKYTQALTFGKDILVGGDLNCDMLKPHSPQANALLDLCNSVNLNRLIKEPTRVTENSSNLINVIMTSSNNIVEESGVVVSHVGDHFLVYTSLKLKLPWSPSGSVNIRSYKNYDCDKFVKDLKQVSWDETAFVDNVREMLDRFNTNFLSVLESHAPINTMRIRPCCCPFVNTEIKELKRGREGLLRNACCTGMPLDWELYHDLREEVKTKLREVEKGYIEEELERSQNTRLKWEVIRSCIPRRETTQQVYTTELKEVADEFNQFFTSVGAWASEPSRFLLNIHNLVPLLVIVPDNEISEVDKFCFHPVSSREIQKIVMSLPSNKAPGHNKVSTSVLKDALLCILPILIVIVNRSLLTSVFPSAWKKSEVVPLLKEGDHKIANNNCPVSVLPVASKVCE